MSGLAQQVSKQGPAPQQAPEQEQEQAFDSNQAAMELLEGRFGADPGSGGGTGLLDLVEKDAPTGMPYQSEVEAQVGELPNARVYAGTEGAGWALAVMGVEAAVIGDVMFFASAAPPLEMAVHEARHLQQTGGQAATGPLTMSPGGSAQEQEADRVGMVSETGDPNTAYAWSWRGFAAGALGGAVIGGIIGFVAGGVGGAVIGAVAGAVIGGVVVGALTDDPTPEQQVRTALDGQNAATVLQVLAGVQEAEFRTILASWNQADTRWLLTNLPNGADAGLVRRIRAERVVQGALTMEDGLRWSGPAGPDGNSDPTTTTQRPVDDLTSNATENNNDEFAMWILGQGPEPTNAGLMNCWEAVMFSAYRGGVVAKPYLVNIYNQCKVAGQAGGPGAWSAALEGALGFNGAVAMDATHEPGRGDIVFMNGLSHVALSLGSTDNAGEHEVLSLWILPRDGQNLNSAFQRCTLENINNEWVNVAQQQAMDITFAPNPF